MEKQKYHYGIGKDKMIFLILWVSSFDGISIIRYICMHDAEKVQLSSQTQAALVVSALLKRGVLQSEK